MHENTDIEEIIQMAAVVGVDYDSYWSQMCAQVNTIQESCSPWREEDFMYLDDSLFLVRQHPSLGFLDNPPCTPMCIH